MQFNNYRDPRKILSKYTPHLLLIVALIFIGSIITAFGNDDAEITKVETRKIATPTPITTEVKPSDVYFDVPLDKNIQKYIFTMCSESDTCTLDPAIVIAVIWKESDFDANAIGDNGNSLGLMQIQPRWHSDRMEKVNGLDLLDPYQNIRVGIDYLIELYSIDNDIEWVLMAYNGGPTYANSLRSQGLVSDYALDILDKAEELKANSRI